ncbi:hypothetical protein F5Y15DRAFT_412522 [Xylariaceae sp. FL0016]|nr:hypothetical protein F5Y15DRAFT_412522 [Xylariaceae sp. FL0016]
MTAVPKPLNARELVSQIAEDHGYLDPEEVQQIEAVSPELRRKVEGAFLKKDLLIGSTVITLAKNLYTSKARFVFELLQNADDNAYTKAKASSSVPCVSFRIYPRRIVFECNEDGFTNENLLAICSVGKSSKTGAQGYIGEKGIGFKSVFMVASKVHIHSGDFSFSFRHKNGESGMGMISPIWEETGEDLSRPLTRFTLDLHDTGDADILRKTHESIQTQFEKLQDTILLFLKNIRRIHVAFHNDLQEETSSTTYSVEYPQTNHAILRRKRLSDGKTQEDAKRFHVTTHEASNLAKNENRTYSKVEEATRAYSRSQITLAFPLSDNFTPIIEPQYLFAFLPVRPVGFNFLLQADFVTDASRQDIVQDSLRNNNLLPGIAEAFIKAILQFCNHDTLKYQWMRYLPNPDNQGLPPLWRSLVAQISRELRIAHVLYGRSEFQGRLISSLVTTTNDFGDENGHPLFFDENPELIVSERYMKRDLNILLSHGLRRISCCDVIELVTSDLRRGSSSRMRSPHTTEGWHTRAADLLNRLLKSNCKCGKNLKCLDLLPLENGTWTSLGSGAVYFGQVDDKDIPSDVHLRLVSKTVTNTHRLELFKCLGAETASISTVRNAILDLYPHPPSLSPSYSIQSSKCHLEFLYLTQEMASDDERPYKVLSVCSSSGVMYRPYDTLMYVTNNEPYGARELLGQTPPGSNPGDGAPGYFAFFLHEDYLKSPSASGQTRLDWLHDKISVKRYVPVNGRSSLTSAGEYLQKHRPDKFLGALSESHKHSHLSADFITSVQNIDVLCRGRRMVPLKDVYFPTHDLEKLVDRFVGPDVPFPWLMAYGEATADTIPLKWRNLLRCLGVGIPVTSLCFALDMLKQCVDAWGCSMTPHRMQRIFELYDHIQVKCREETDPAAAEEIIRKTFTENKYICVPHGDSKCTWTLPNECLWDAPRNLMTKFALKTHLKSCYCRDGSKCPLFQRFFLDTLYIRIATCEDYVEELKALKKSCCGDFDRIKAMYEAINDLQPTVNGNANIKESFENEALIYVPADDGASGAAWHKVSDCVWSKAARLRGRVALNDDYEDLEQLFVGFLGVRPVDLAMAIDELKQVGSKNSTSVPEIKDSIWTVNSLLSLESKPPKASAVMKCSILPIRYPQGGVTLAPVATECFIIDRERLRQLFESKVKVFDFTLDEVVRLKHFLAWVDANDRYISRCVQEITSFPGGKARPVSNPELQIRHRAYPLVRIASHFSSPRSRLKRDLEYFYQILRTSEVYETDDISSNLQVQQDGQLHVVESGKETLHIDETQSGLKIYVPRNKDDQQYMFSKSLGPKLFEWMMRHPVTQISERIDKEGISATKDILNAPHSRLDEALEDNGILEVDIVNVDEPVPGAQLPATPGLSKAFLDSTSDNNVEGEQEHLGGANAPRDIAHLSRSGLTEPLEHDDVTESDIENTDGNVSQPESPAASRISEASQTSTSNDEVNERECIKTPTSSIEVQSSNFYHSVASSRHQSARSPRPVSAVASSWMPLSPPDDYHTHEVNALAGQHYVALLDKVIIAARQATLPSQGAFGMGGLHASLPNLEDLVRLDLRSASRVERNCKIGAAGELYVFELLSHINVNRPLVGFVRDNWKSKIRKFVSVHPEYSDMEPWNGIETSDITHLDAGGVLTDLLIENGYLPRDVWAGRSPYYFIEVKTTTSTCETPFYMSKAQYRRMQENTLTEANTIIIYVIFRVYNLGQDNMGLRIYLDPESLRLSGHLDFTTEQWSIVPTPV